MHAEVHMVLGNSHMEAVLAALHPEVPRASIAARLRYFQRRDYPSGNMNVGKGWRIEYGVVDVLKLAVTYELLVSFVPPDDAMKTVKNHWSAVEGTFRKAVEAKEEDDPLPILFVGTGIAAKNQATAILEPVAMTDLHRWLKGGGEERLLTVLDTVRMVRALERTLVGGAGEKGAAMAAALKGWAKAKPDRSSAKKSPEALEAPSSA